jgi:hypothetical protein
MAHIAAESDLDLLTKCAIERKGGRRTADGKSFNQSWLPSLSLVRRQAQ